MKILVKFYQALTSNTVISILKERMFGWSVEDQSFIYKEADGSENGLTKYIPSIIGNGTNIKVVMEGHSLNKHDLVRLDLTGNYVNSISTLDNSQNATHYVFDVQGDDVYLAQHGSWKMISPKGKRYLSSSQSNTMTSAYTGVEQSVGVCDGTFFHVNFNENKTSQRYNKVLAIGSPMVGMDFTLLYTSKPTTIMKIKSVINGVGTSDIVVSYSSNRNLSGSVTQISSWTITSNTIGDELTLSTNNVPSDCYLVLSVVGVSGSVESLETIIIYEEQ